jgi:hypothetical protein
MVGTAQVHLCPPYGFEFQTANTVIASASEAIQLFCTTKGRKLDCFVAFAPRNDVRMHSRGAMRPGFALQVLPYEIKGAGNAGRAMRPQPCVQN